MSKVSVNGRIFDIDAAVFDKDGLLFDSQPFWRLISEKRGNAAADVIGLNLATEWLRAVGAAVCTNGDNRLSVTAVRPDGFTALAPVDDEIAFFADFVKRRTGCGRQTALEQARIVFARADEQLDCSVAFVPRPGFPEIFHRLRIAGVPFGIASSDKSDRIRQAVRPWYDTELLSFIITPDDVGNNKPAPDMLELAGRLCSVPTTHLLVLGDSYVDMQMAKSAGAAGVGIPENEAMLMFMLPYADEIIRSLDDVIILQP